MWYSTRANTSYCFVCSSPTSCTHTKLKNNPNPNSSSYGQAKISISWKVSLAKCVDSSPLVVGYSLEEDGGREGSRIICYVGSHKGMVVAVEGISTSFFFFSFSCFFFCLFHWILLISLLANDIILDGDVLWSCDVGARVESSPAVSNTGKFIYHYLVFHLFIFVLFFLYIVFISLNSHRYVGSYDGSLVCINCSLGTVDWKFQTGNQVKSSPYPENLSSSDSPPSLLPLSVPSFPIHPLTRLLFSFLFFSFSSLLFSSCS